MIALEEIRGVASVVLQRSDEETTHPLYADDRNFYKVEWTQDGTKGR
jgi:hypothetical protein